MHTAFAQAHDLLLILNFKAASDVNLLGAFSSVTSRPSSVTHLCLGCSGGRAVGVRRGCRAVVEDRGGGILFLPLSLGG